MTMTLPSRSVRKRLSSDQEPEARARLVARPAAGLDGHDQDLATPAEDELPS
jgi:hypothetical protein